jgi:pimeloyl-ACP methyl ester carboxylesterase
MDPQHIYPVGYAIGGTVALLAAALDPRITGVASVCGVTPWRGDGDDQPTGGIRRWWQWHALLPKLGLFHGREGEIPLDFDDLLTEVAPRPCFIEAPQRDRTVEHQAVLECIDQARPHWQAADHADRLTLHTPDEPNQLLRGQQDRLAAWLQIVTRSGSA